MIGVIFRAIYSYKINIIQLLLGGGRSQGLGFRGLGSDPPSTYVQGDLSVCRAHRRGFRGASLKRAGPVQTPRVRGHKKEILRVLLSLYVENI